MERVKKKSSHEAQHMFNQEDQPLPLLSGGGFSLFSPNQILPEFQSVMPSHSHFTSVPLPRSVSCGSCAKSLQPSSTPSPPVHPGSCSSWAHQRPLLNQWLGSISGVSHITHSFTSPFTSRPNHQRHFFFPNAYGRKNVRIFSHII